MGFPQDAMRGRSLRVKRRKRGSEQIAALANTFFPLAQAPITVLGDLKRWQRWEVDCFHLLNGAEFHAFILGPRTVCAERLPGRSLRRLAQIRKLTHRRYKLPRWKYGAPINSTSAFSMGRGRTAISTWAMSF